MISASENALGELECCLFVCLIFFSQNKICAFLKQGIWINTIIYLRVLRDRNCTIDKFGLTVLPVTITAELVSSINARSEA
jgi:hypothetical protein